MFRKKTNRFFLSLIIGAVLLIVGFIFLNNQKEERSTYFAIRDGGVAEATLYRFDDHNEGFKNYYYYVFTAEDGKQYANSTVSKYNESYEGEYAFFVNYAIKDGEVVLSGGEKEINGKTYKLAKSRESLYYKNTPPPTLTMCSVVLVGASFIIFYCLYNGIWILFYKHIERTGTLTYALFIEASASRSGSNRFMSIKYKYKDLDDNWIEASSPYTFSAIMAEKLKIMETFKIRYKGKFSMIAEDIKPIRI